MKFLVLDDSNKRKLYHIVKPSYIVMVSFSRNIKKLNKKYEMMGMHNGALSIDKLMFRINEFHFKLK